MKKQEKITRISFDPIILYIDDVKRIFEIISDVSEHFSVIADGYVLDDKSEIDMLDSKEIHELIITSNEINVSIEMKNYQTVIWGNEKDTKSWGTILVLKDLLEKCQRKIWKIRKTFYPSYLILYSFVSLSMSLVKDIGKWRIYVLIPGVIIYVIVAILFIMDITVRAKKYSTIRLYKRGMNSFFIRQKDQILLSIISGIIGALLTLAITMIMK
jgi:hypothetical protein